MGGTVAVGYRQVFISEFCLRKIVDMPHFLSYCIQFSYAAHLLSNSHR